MNLPDEFQKKMLEIFPQAIGEEILHSLCGSLDISIRANTLKISAEELRSHLENSGVELQSVIWYKNALTVTNKTTRELTDLQEYKDGLFYIQSLSSMIPAIVLDPQRNEKVLDLAAAPGSKTTQLAMMMQNEGEIVANDLSRDRIYKLEDNLRSQGVKNVKTILGAGEKIWEKYPEYFDKVLADVPCSMEGRFKCDDPKSYSHWSQKKVKMLAKQQQWLLRSAVSACKPGGTIIYSTCTISPEENEGVIDWILEKEQGKITLEEINITNIESYPAITQWGNKIYNPEVSKTLRILPSKNMEGFYIAKIKKVASNISYR